MSRLAALDSERHRDLRVNPAHGASYGDNVPLCPLVTAELGDAAADVPVLLARDGDTGEIYLAALLGFDEGENLMLDGSRWTARHKPLRLQHAPFYAHAGDEDLKVYIDLDSPRVTRRGEPLFEADGAPSPYLEHIRSVLAELLAGQAATRAFAARLLDLGLAQPIGLALPFSDGQRRLDDLFSVNRDAVAGLADAAVVALHRSGELELIHLMMASLRHLDTLVDIKQARVAAMARAANG